MVRQKTIRDYPFLIRLTADEKKDIEKFAEKNDLSQAQVVRQAVKKFIKK